mmetsp:Transcript_20399/g.24500  ORF Transcript_20399/g.24500 Transcript_20399/m.24500 type:complete len:101 (-) Transcript_20399:926-1228(-)
MNTVDYPTNKRVGSTPAYTCLFSKRCHMDYYFFNKAANLEATLEPPGGCWVGTALELPPTIFSSSAEGGISEGANGSLSGRFGNWTGDISVLPPVMLSIG